MNSLATKIDVQNREIWLVPDNDNLEIDSKTAVEFSKNLRDLCLINNNPVLVHLYCNGGSVEDGFVIYDNIKLANCTINMIAHNGALSMGGIILQSVKPVGLRYMTPSSLFMVHSGSLAIGETTPANANKIMSHSKELDKKIVEIYAESCQTYGSHFIGQSIKKISSFWKRAMSKNEDLYFDADTAVRYGLCDKILTKEDYKKEEKRKTGL